MRWYFSNTTRLGLALVASSLSSILLFFVIAFAIDSFMFSYLIWNLFLAWVPLAIALWLHKILKRKLWSSWEALFVTMLWLGFLPNTFYMVTDYIHVQDVPSSEALYASVVLSSFVFNGVILGCLSLYNVHYELLHRVKRWTAHSIIAGVILLSSFAIYLGRDLRWNTWDLIINPGGILIDVSDRILHPLVYLQTYTTTAVFFVLITGVYAVGWQMVRAMRYQKVLDDAGRQGE